MLDYVDSLAARYRSRGVLLDTSLLLLLYIGLHDPAQVKRFPRTRQISNTEEVFTDRDFEYINAFVTQFDRLITTPHILTEVSNFLGQLRSPVRNECFAVFARHVADPSTQEYAPSAEELSARAEFIPFGITDTSIAEVAADQYLVLTTDARLNAHLARNGIDSLNYNNFRLDLLS